jgi:hypothetical protein
MPANLSTEGQMFFNCLQTYGAYVGDYTGGDWPMFYYAVPETWIAGVDPVWRYDHLFVWWDGHAEVPGIGQKNVTNRQIVSTVATLTVANHGYSSGTWLTVNGVGAKYNGPRQITSVATNTISFSVSSNAADESYVGSSGSVTDKVADLVKIWPLVRVADYQP